MKKHRFWALMPLLFLPLSGWASGISECEVALEPTIDNATSDYSMAQSYMYVNAAYEYDKLKNMSSRDRGASASYKFFSAEYNDSKSSSKFHKKVRNRLSKEGFSLQESEAKSSYRRYLSESQLNAWSTCVREASNGAALIITAESVSNSEFPIKLKWYPQQGVGSGQLMLKIRNAKIDGKNNINVLLNGKTEKPFIVEPDINSNPIVITAEIVGTSDVLTLPRKFPKTAPPVIRIAKYSLDNGIECKKNNQCKSQHCYPGPSSFPISKGPGNGSTWYCVAADKNCAFPGTGGYMYGAKKKDNGSLLTCKNPQKVKPKDWENYKAQFMR